MEIEVLQVPLPAPRTKQSRLTEKMKALEVGQSFMADFKTAQCYAAWCNRTGRKAVRCAKANGEYLVGRIA